MVIVMKKESTREDLARVTLAVEELGFHAHVRPGNDRTVVGSTGTAGPLDPVS